MSELRALPGIGDAYLAAIIKNRLYANMRQLLSRKVVPQATYDKISLIRSSRNRPNELRVSEISRQVKRRWRTMQGPRTIATACAVIAGIEGVQMIRKGQVLGITRSNRGGWA